MVFQWVLTPREIDEIVGSRYGFSNDQSGMMLIVFIGRDALKSTPVQQTVQSSSKSMV